MDRVRAEGNADQIVGCIATDRHGIRFLCRVNDFSRTFSSDDRSARPNPMFFSASAMNSPTLINSGGEGLVIRYRTSHEPALTSSAVPALISQLPTSGPIGSERFNFRFACHPGTKPQNGNRRAKQVNMHRRVYPVSYETC